MSRVTAAISNLAVARGRKAWSEVEKCWRERKVRTPQGSAPGNSRAGQPDGQWHRKYTALSEASMPKGIGAESKGKGEMVG